MADAARLLDTLHAMREPPPPAPVVPVLIMLGVGCGVAAILLFAAWRVAQRRSALRGAALAALAASRRLAAADRLAAQALLLRRLARAAQGEEAARAQGNAWLERLDALFETRFFTQGAGTAYGDALYRRAPIDVDALDGALSGFIGKAKLGATPAARA